MTPAAESDLIAALGLAVFERTRIDQYCFAAAPPAWIQNFFAFPVSPVGGAAATEVVLLDHFPFLEVFVPDAEEFWVNPGERSALPSDLWTQTDAGGVERHLRATALLARAANGGRRRLIVIVLAERRFQEKQALVHFAHETSLASEKIAKLNRELELATQAKSEFVARMSHEIRTPLNALLGMAELLSETPLQSEQCEYIRILRRAGTNLLDLVNDILDFSKIQAGQVELEQIEFDLLEVLEEAAEVSAVRAHAKGLEISCRIDDEVPRKLIGDPAKLRQILLNLLSNATKFTDRGELTVRVRLADEPAKTSETHLHFTVADTGIGIPPDRLSSIFDSFTQVDASTTRKYGGTGLGLSISKRFAELMGGRIWAESKPGSGTAMHFLANFSVAEKATAPIPGLDGLRCLVVEENPNHRASVADLLFRLGVHANTCDSATSAMAELSKERASSEAMGRPPVDFIFLDVHLPEAADGKALADSLERKDSRVRLVAMLTTDRLSDADRYRASGWGTITKPVRRSALIAILQGNTPRGDARPNLATQSDFKALRILLADDSEDNRLVIRGYLKDTGCVIDEAENGAIALDKFKSGTYDIVLTDAEMPEMDGYTATREMRAHEQRTREKTTPILALTAHATQAARQRSLEAGCTSHLTKPIQRASLLKALAEYAQSATVSTPSPDEREPWLTAILPGYLEKCRHDVSLLFSALEQADYATVRRIGHQLAGTGTSYGFPLLTELGASLEQAAVDADAARIRDRAEKLRECLAEIHSNP